MFTIFTLNAALLTITILGIPIYSLQSHPRTRLAQLVDSLTINSYDVVALEKISPIWQKKLIKKLSDIYPYHSNYRTDNIITSEILVLSKFPISNISFDSYDQSTKFESVGLKKGMLELDIKTDTKTVHLIATHLVASGFLKSATDPEVETIRESEIDELINHTKNLITQDSKRPVLVLGDFNAGLEVSRDNYNELCKYFTDLYVADKEVRSKDEPIYTWLPNSDQNFISKIEFKSSPAERIDFVLVPTEQINLLKPTTTVNIISNNFSDHAGVASQVEFID